MFSSGLGFLLGCNEILAFKDEEVTSFYPLGFPPYAATSDALEPHDHINAKLTK